MRLHRLWCHVCPRDLNFEGSCSSRAGPGRDARIRQHVRAQDGLRLPPWAAGATSTTPFHSEMPEVFATSIALARAEVVRRIGATRPIIIGSQPTLETVLIENLSSIGSRTIKTAMLFYVQNIIETHTKGSIVEIFLKKTTEKNHS
ncbi:hypothetical protein EVAR_68723_1 [Eumeta japonica]|uniref:Uncharacterized protein n=1 Tax=Eumeta variegata TaxID=151549 RepID=A0A4C2A628_EUMVA|nr:hypothetical protein EVAR_68723_1 [Eumeta japonica]